MEEETSIPPKGQRQALGHIQPYREWQAMGQSCSYMKATHTAVQLNDGDSDMALSQSAYFTRVGHSMVRETFGDEFSPKDREGS